MKQNKLLQVEAEPYGSDIAYFDFYRYACPYCGAEGVIENKEHVREDFLIVCDYCLKKFELTTNI